MSKKIVFMGTPEFAVPTLEALKNSNNEILAFILNQLVKQIEVKNY